MILRAKMILLEAEEDKTPELDAEENTGDETTPKEDTKEDKTPELDAEENTEPPVEDEDTTPEETEEDKTTELDAEENTGGETTPKEDTEPVEDEDTTPEETEDESSKVEVSEETKLSTLLTVFKDMYVNVNNYIENIKGIRVIGKIQQELYDNIIMSLDTNRDNLYLYITETFTTRTFLQNQEIFYKFQTSCEYIIEMIQKLKDLSSIEETVN